MTVHRVVSVSDRRTLDRLADLITIAVDDVSHDIEIATVPTTELARRLTHRLLELAATEGFVITRQVRGR